MKKWIQQLKDAEIGTVLENEPLSKHTSWRIGGPADAFIEPQSINGLIKAIKILNEYNIPWKTIGKGSNLLVLDSGFRGAIIRLTSAFSEIVFEESTIHVGPGFSLIRLANLAAKKGLTGLEFAGGIPGLVGGAIYMNAGAHGSDISNILLNAEILLENGEVEVWNKDDFKFDYRTSILQKKKGIILSASFRLRPGNRKEIAEKMANYKDRRHKTQPYHLPCSGSVFRNPVGEYAGRLIEQLGLKGYKVGDAQVSTMHANFIVNTGHATAKDILTVVKDVQQKVYEAYKIELIPEVEMVGEA